MSIERRASGRAQTWTKPYDWRKPTECVVCGELFTPKTPRQKTCGVACSVENNRRKSREWRERNPDWRP